MARADLKVKRFLCLVLGSILQVNNYHQIKRMSCFISNFNLNIRNKHFYRIFHWGESNTSISRDLWKGAMRICNNWMSKNQKLMKFLIVFRFCMRALWLPGNLIKIYKAFIIFEYQHHPRKFEHPQNLINEV